MILEETIKIMREKNNDEKFYPLIESMKRRADKGLLEGVTSNDIESALKKLEKENISENSSINLNQELFELNEAIENHNDLEIESWSEEELQEGIMYEFLKDLSLLESYSLLEYDDLDREKEENKFVKGTKKVAGTAAGGAIATGVGVDAVRNFHNMGATALGDGSSKLAKFGQGTSMFHNNVLKPIGKSIVTPFKHLGTTIAGQGGNLALAGLGGVLAGVGVYGAYRLIRHLIRRRKRKKERDLTENVLFLELFSDDYSAVFHNIISQLSESQINFLLENGSDDTKELLENYGQQLISLTEKHSIEELNQISLSEGVLSGIAKTAAVVGGTLVGGVGGGLGVGALLSARKAKKQLKKHEEQQHNLQESVTFIDNAGNLKTMLTPDYVKDQHEYRTETQIEKYEKKKKKRDYKLISEEIDINSLKKLSEMSFEEILAEDL